MPATASTSLDMRGKTITTFIAYAAARRLTELAEGETLELLTDASDAIDNDIRAWCRATEQELASTGHSDGTYRYAITKASLPPGTDVVVEGWQAKDGSNRANGSNITLPDGKKLFVGSSGTGAPFEKESGKN